MTAPQATDLAAWLDQLGIDTRPEPYGDLPASVEERLARIAERLRSAVTAALGATGGAW